MKTREEEEDLKQNWVNDPCWDIEETEGFEEYREELSDFAKQEIIKRDERIRQNELRQIREAKVDCVEDYRYNGLTKREIFAAMAMQSRINAHCPTRSMTDQEIKFISIDSIRCADALINELNKQNETD